MEPRAQNTDYWFGPGGCSAPLWPDPISCPGTKGFQKNLYIPWEQSMVDLGRWQMKPVPAGIN